MRRAEVVGAVLARAGVPRLLDQAFGTRRLTVLAYHRIVAGDPDEFDFDPGLISATPEGFARQVDWVARNFSVVGVDDLVDIVDGRTSSPARPLLITFDDGYLDNHREALPVLRARGVPACAFLVSEWVGGDHLPWWDECAYRLRHTDAAMIDVPPIGRLELDRSPGGRERTLAAIGAVVKVLPDDRLPKVLELLWESLPVATTPPVERRFLDWDEAAEMERAGFACQSHTARHPILSRIDAGRLARELSESAQAIGTRLGRPVRTLAYPNGRPDDHGPAVHAALAEAGYRLAFTMEAGPTRPAEVQAAPFQVDRTPVERGDTFDLFRLKVMGIERAASSARSRVRALPRRVRPRARVGG